jgi:hypothetical protein
MSERSRWLLPVLLSMLFVYQMRSARRWPTFATIPISLRFSDRDRALGSRLPADAAGVGACRLGQRGWRGGERCGAVAELAGDDRRRD